MYISIYGCIFHVIVVFRYSMQSYHQRVTMRERVMLPNPTNRRPPYNGKSLSGSPLRQLFSSTHRNPEFTSAA
jgi:hypothetical protein